MPIAIFGAGSVGCYIGGRLAAGGARVTLIGRPRLRDELARHGLHLSDYRGAQTRVRDIPFALGPEGVAGSGLVLVCVKSQDSEAAARALAPHLTKATQIVSFQNGVRNAETLARALGRPVLAGMVGFNIVAQGGGRFHQGTQGDLHGARDPGLTGFLGAFKSAGLPLTLHSDMRPVLWAKLMLNLNNAVNALANIPLRAQLSDRRFRLCLALAQEELLYFAGAASLPALARLAPLPAAWIPRVLRLPDPLFRAVAGRMLRIDPQARSSMSDDLALGRVPEVAWINGEVVRLAKSLGRDAPVNRRLCALIDDAADAATRPTWAAQDLLADLRAVLR